MTDRDSSEILRRDLDISSRSGHQIISRGGPPARATNPSSWARETGNYNCQGPLAKPWARRVLRAQGGKGEVSASDGRHVEPWQARSFGCTSTPVSRPLSTRDRRREQKQGESRWYRLRAKHKRRRPSLAIPGNGRHMSRMQRLGTSLHIVRPQETKPDLPPCP